MNIQNIPVDYFLALFFEIVGLISCALSAGLVIAYVLWSLVQIWRERESA